MAKKGNQSVVIEQYDKVLAVVVLAGLLFSLLWLTFSTDRRQREEDAYREAINALTPRRLEGTGFDLGVYSNAMQQLARPKQISADVAEVGFFVPERRVWCVGCAKPVAYAAEVCPFCGEEQPDASGVVVSDTDGDGMPDVWERQYGFDPFDKNDAHGDADGDGFTNLEEYLSGTDPRDPKSHSDVDVLLRVKEIVTKRIPLVFQAKSAMPNGKFRCQFNRQDGDRQSFWVDEGQPIGNTGFVLLSLEPLEEKRRDPTVGIRSVDVSVARLQRLTDEKVFELRINDEAFAEVVVELVLPLDNTTYPVVSGGTFTLREARYRVISVDNKALTVVIESESTGKRLTIGR